MKSIITLISCILIQTSQAAVRSNTIGEDEPKKGSELRHAQVQIDRDITEATDLPIMPLVLDYTWADRAADDIAMTESALPAVAPLEIQVSKKPATSKKPTWRSPKAGVQH